MSIAAAAERFLERDPRYWQGVWRLVDPKISLASIVALVAGTAVAYSMTRSISPIAVALVFLTILAVEVGKNAVNDLYDFRSGTDSDVRVEERSPFSGGKRVLVDGLLTQDDLIRIAWIAFGVAGVCGVTLALAINPWLFLLGLIGAAIAVEYTAPPLQLSYHGLGEMAVFLMYGPGLVLGTIALLTGTISATAIAASTVLGLLIANVLLLNEFPDERPDRVAGKRTLVVILGRARAKVLATLLFLTAFSIALLAPFVSLGWTLTGLLAGVPFAAAALTALWTTLSGPPVRAQALTLAAYVAAGAGIVASSLWMTLR